MKEIVELKFEDDDYKCFTEDTIAILKIKSNAFVSLTNIDRSRKLIKWFDIVEENNELKGVLVINEKGSFGIKAYEDFVNSITRNGKSSQKDYHSGDFDKTDIRIKEINVLNTFVTITIKSKKLFISGLNGSIVTPFFGSSLATNYRIASEDMKISLNHAKYQLHATGALPFFLPKFIGLGDATKYVLYGGEISAVQAMEMGLVDEIVPTTEFENKCIEKSLKLLDFKKNYLRWSKELLTSYKEDLMKYIHLEEKFVEHY